MSNPPKFPRIYHWPSSPGVQNDDKIHNDPKSFIGTDVIIREKLDGSNTCLHNGKVYSRSTGQESNNGWHGPVKKYHAWKSLEFPNIALYGEDIAAHHSIRYNVPIEETFYPFAALDLETNEFLTAYELAALGDFPILPMRFKGQFNSEDELSRFLDEEIKKPGLLGGEVEGFVISTPYGFQASEFSQNVCKYVRANHVQTDEHWTRNWEWNEFVPLEVEVEVEVYE